MVENKQMRKGVFAIFLLFFISRAMAQANYEIQVYGSELVAPRRTMVELHTNNTLRGSKTTDEFGMLPTNHVQHETIEITHGWNKWFETGFYIFNWQ